jgi:hypothetical protein
MTGRSGAATDLAHRVGDVGGSFDAFERRAHSGLKNL